MCAVPLGVSLVSDCSRLSEWCNRGLSFYRLNVLGAHVLGALSFYNSFCARSHLAAQILGVNAMRYESEYEYQQSNANQNTDSKGAGEQGSGKSS